MNLKLGICLPSYLYNEEREKLANDAFGSLAKSEPLVDEVTLLLLIESGSLVKYTPYLEDLRKKFRTVIKVHDSNGSAEQKFAYGTSYLIDAFGIDTVVWMTDDTLHHPLWLWKLEGLVRRHPDAKAWSVYRSSFELMHRTIKEEGEDVLVHSVCGHGMTLSAKEWKAWGMTAEKAAGYGSNGQVTLDVEHPEVRPGERWVTKRSWIEHTGKTGVHTALSIPEYAKDFVGTK